MELTTISQVSKEYNVSTRTLRYYEKIGLLNSCKKEDYAYRTYDDEAIRRLQQIIILRKLIIPLKQIAFIFENNDLSQMLKIFQKNIKELEEEISARSTVRNVLKEFVDKLSEHIRLKSNFDLLNDKEILTLVESLSLSKINLKEKKSMEEINNANNTIDKMKDVRIIYIPPMTIASSHFIGPNPEDAAQKQIDEFIRAVRLNEIKPDFRVLGFNNPSPNEDQEYYGYEFWVTIPENMNVPEPLTKKNFDGGLYAAHCIKMGDFHEWQQFFEWAKNNPEYDIDYREPYGMGGCLEEHLNAFTYYTSKEKQFIQLDLLIPIKKKS